MYQPICSTHHRWKHSRYPWSNFIFYMFFIISFQNSHKSLVMRRKLHLDSLRHSSSRLPKTNNFQISNQCRCVQSFSFTDVSLHYNKRRHVHVHQTSFIVISCVANIHYFITPITFTNFRLVSSTTIWYVNLMLVLSIEWRIPCFTNFRIRKNKNQLSMKYLHRTFLSVFWYEESISNICDDLL